MFFVSGFGSPRRGNAGNYDGFGSPRRGLLLLIRSRVFSNPVRKNDPKIKTPGPPNTTPGPPNTTPGPPNTTPGQPNTTPGLPNTTPGPPNTTKSVSEAWKMQTLSVQFSSVQCSIFVSGFGSPRRGNAGNTMVSAARGAGCCC